ncbi:MAG: hypothetical protein QW279_03600 [Candidatus Jordarchaeaceae archaeon]
MNEETKRKMIRNYFKPFPKWAIWMLLIGVIVFFIGISAHTVGAIAFGLIIFVIGVVGIVSYSQGKPTDQQIDEWFEEDKKMLEKVALDRLGTVEEEAIKEPLTLCKPIYWGVEGIHPDDIMLKKGKDGFTRFSIWDVAIFHLTDKYLGSFKATFNFLNGKTVNEHTEEFFYKDIVKVGTAQESVILKNGTKITDAASFVLKVSSGDSIFVRDITFRLEEKGTKVIPTSPIGKTIQAIRTMVREKKT